MRPRGKLHQPRIACVHKLIDLIERFKHWGSVQIGTILSNQRGQCLLPLRGLTLGCEENHLNEPQAEQVAAEVFILGFEQIVLPPISRPWVQHDAVARFTLPGLRSYRTSSELHHAALDLLREYERPELVGQGMRSDASGILGEKAIMRQRGQDAVK